MSAVAEENRQLKLQNLELLQQMAQIKADRDFVWSLWRRLQMSSPDVTGAVTSVMQREKTKLDALEQSFAQRLANSESRFISLDSRVRDLESENAQLKVEMASSEEQALMNQNVAKVLRDEAAQLRNEVAILRSENAQLREETDRYRNETVRLRGELRDAEFAQSHLANFDQTVSRLRADHERELTALRNEAAQVRLELELKARECECLVEDLRQQVDLTEQIQRFYDAAQRDAVTERERFATTLADRDAQIERSHGAVSERDARMRQLEDEINRLTGHLDIAAHRLHGNPRSTGRSRSARSLREIRSDSVLSVEEPSSERFFEQMDTIRERERERRDRAITEMFAEIRGVRDRIDELERCAERDELGASQVRDARDRLSVLERRTEQLARENAALREENLDLLFAARSLERKNTELLTERRSRKRTVNRNRSRLDRSAPPAFLTSSSISGSENEDRLDRSHSGERRIEDPLFQLDDAVHVEDDEDMVVAAANASRRALADELRRVRAQLVRRQLELDTARRQVATLRAAASRRRSRLDDIMAARSASRPTIGATRTRTRSVPASLYRAELELDQEQDQELDFEQFAFPDLRVSRPNKSSLRNRSRTRARSELARSEVDAISKHIRRVQRTRRSASGAPLLSATVPAPAPAIKKRQKTRKNPNAAIVNTLRELETRCARQRDEIASLRDELRSSRNETAAQKDSLQRCRSDLAKLRVRYRVVRNMSCQSTEPSSAVTTQRESDVPIRSQSRSPVRVSSHVDTPERLVTQPANRSGDHIDGRFDAPRRTPQSNAGQPYPSATRDRDSLAAAAEAHIEATRDREVREAKAEARRFAKQNLELRTLSVALKNELAAKREAENELRARATRLDRELRSKRDTIAELRRRCDELSQRIEEAKRERGEEGPEKERSEKDKEQSSSATDEEQARRRAAFESQARQLEVLRNERASLKSALEAAQRGAKDAATKRRDIERRSRSTRDQLETQLTEARRAAEQHEALANAYKDKLNTLSRFVHDRLTGQVRRFADAFQRVCITLKGQLHRALDALALRDEQLASTRAQLDAVARANRQLETFTASTATRRRDASDDGEALRAAQKKACEILQLPERDVEQLLTGSREDSGIAVRRTSPRSVDRGSLRALLQTPYDDVKWLEVVGTLLDAFERSITSSIAVTSVNKTDVAPVSSELHAEQVWQVLDMATSRLQNLVNACEAALG